MIEFCMMVKDGFQPDCWKEIGKDTSDWSAEKNQADEVCPAGKPELADVCKNAYDK